MFRNLGRVHIASFAVGIVGTIIGIVGIVLAIVFGTASSPTCPQTVQSACNSKLFSLQTGINDLKWNDDLNDPNSLLFRNESERIANELTQSLTNGLNSNSNSKFRRYLLNDISQPTDNNVIIQIYQFQESDTDGVVAIGAGAVSSARPVAQLPSDGQIISTVNSDTIVIPNTAAATNKTCRPEDCCSCEQSTVSTTCGTSVPVTTVDITSTVPTSTVVSSTIQTSTVLVTQSSTQVATTQGQNSTTFATTTSQGQPSTTVQTSTTVSSTITTQGQSSTTVPSTTQGQTSSSTQLPSSTVQTTTVSLPPSTTSSQASSPTASSTTTTQGQTSTIVPSTTQGQTSTSTQLPSSTVQTTTASLPLSTTSSQASSPTTNQGQTSTIVSSTTQSQTSTATSTVQTSTASQSPTTTSFIPPITPNPTSQCYYQSNVAVAFEMSSGTADIGPDSQIQNFISNNLFFYPNNVYKLAPREFGLTSLALVPYPNSQLNGVKNLMNYGSSYDSSSIQTLFTVFGMYPLESHDISQSFTKIATLPSTGYRGFVILIGTADEYVPTALQSAQNLKDLGFGIVTVAYNTSADFTPLESKTGYDFVIRNAADEVTVARSIGDILNTTYCLRQMPQPSSTTGTATTLLTSTTTASAITSTVTPTQGSAPSSQAASSTTQGSTSTPVGSTTVSSISTSTQSQPTSPISPGPCYYQSNVAVAFEMSNGAADIDPDAKIQDFITNKLFFYPNNVYHLGPANSSQTTMALVPYPNTQLTAINNLMNYGASYDSTGIQDLLTAFGLYPAASHDISQSFNKISSLTRTGRPGFVILIGTSDELVASSVPSATNLKNLGFGIITIAYNSGANFTSLASQDDYSLVVNSTADEDVVARSIGNILYASYCLEGSSTTTSGTTLGVSSTVTLSSAGPTSTITPSSTAPTSTSTSASSSTPTTTASSVTSTLTPTQGTAPSSQAASSTTQGSTSTPVGSTTLSSISTSTQSQPTSPISPGPCYYQSNVAVAFEMSNGASDIDPDAKIQDFITTKLFFYPNNVYHLGPVNTGQTTMALVPYPNTQLNSLNTLMNYGASYDSTGIQDLLTAFGLYPAASHDISQSFNKISSLTRTGRPGFVILIGTSDELVASSVPSATNLKNLGFGIITIAYNSGANFTSLASQDGYSFVINSATDEDTVAKSIGNILYASYCLEGSSTTTSGTTLGASSTVTLSSAGPTSTSAEPTSTSAGPTATITPSSTAPTSTSTSASSSSISTITSTYSPTTECVCTTAASEGTTPITWTTTSTSTNGPTTFTPPWECTTVTEQSTTSSGSSTTPQGTTTTQYRSTTSTPKICNGQQAVFDGNVGVVFELVQGSSQKNTILQFVENTLLASNYYALGPDGLTKNRHTLATTLPYPFSAFYNVSSYGSVQNLNDVKTQVEAFNSNIQVPNGDGITDAFLYIASKLPANGTASALIVVGNNGTIVDQTSISVAEILKETFKIFTISIGENSGDFSQLSSGEGYSFTVANGNDQNVANQIALNLEGRSPGIYCPS